MFCKNCGKEISDEASVCPNCGQPQKKIGVSEKNGIIALLLCFFLGVLGIHRFYVGKSGTGITMLLLSITVVGLAITTVWALVDLIIIVTGNFKDYNGNNIKF